MHREFRSKCWDFLRSISFFEFIAFVIGARVLTRCFQQFHRVPWENFLKSSLILPLCISIFTYLSIAWLSFILSKKHQDVRPSVAYLGLLLTTYYLSLINDLILPSHTTLFVYIFIFSLMVYACKTRREPPITTKRASLFQRKYVFIYILIGLWMAHSSFYFLEQNFIMNRTPFADEESFWFSAAFDMGAKGVHFAHTNSYYGGSLHPFGIPFIAALPNLFFGLHLKASYFFMPIVVIVFLTMILYSLRNAKWAFIFFYTALFVAFNDRSWITHLTYQLVYGDVLSAVFFCVLMIDIWRSSDKNNVSVFYFLIMHFIIGLLALSKAPLAYFYPVLLILLYGVCFKKTEASFSRKIIILLCGIILFAAPHLTWNFYKDINQVPTMVMGVTNWKIIFGRLANPNISVLYQSVQNIIGDVENFFYYFVLSFLLIIASGNKKIWIFSTPIILYVFSLSVFYAYIYAYEGGGDAASFFRYLLLIAFSLMYFAGLSFQSIWGRCAKKSWPFLLKSFFALIGVALMVMKLY